MKKVLFLIHDLGQGGAEKVLVNLVNNMDYSQFDVTVMSLFDVGENKQFLNPEVKYKAWCSKIFPGNSHVMKLCTPEKLHKLIIKEKYDIEVSYLEGPCARIISGCKSPNTKLVSWIHVEMDTKEKASIAFRNVKEATKYYNKFDKLVCVSENVKNIFRKSLEISVPMDVLYNTNESDKIINLSHETIEESSFSSDNIKIVGVGKLLKKKGFDRILRIGKRLLDENYSIHIFILGTGPEQEALQKYVQDNNMENRVSFLGYQLNPYKYVAKSDLFVCASYAEGFSTAATEALIVGTPVCTVEVAGMKEMLGEHNEYGLVTNNEDDALYKGIKGLLDNPELLKYYKQQAKIRGNNFKTRSTVASVEKMLISL